MRNQARAKVIGLLVSGLALVVAVPAAANTSSTADAAELCDGDKDKKGSGDARQPASVLCDGDKDKKGSGDARQPASVLCGGDKDKDQQPTDDKHPSS